jgi:hypothetical protein
MTDLCIRCGSAPQTGRDWLHCDACWQLMCDEVHAAQTDVDEIGELMAREGLDFCSAVERLARERGL